MVELAPSMGCLAHRKLVVQRLSNENLEHALVCTCPSLLKANHQIGCFRICDANGFFGFRWLCLILRIKLMVANWGCVFFARVTSVFCNCFLGRIGKVFLAWVDAGAFCFCKWWHHVAPMIGDGSRCRRGEASRLPAAERPSLQMFQTDVRANVLCYPDVRLESTDFPDLIMP